MGTINKLSFGLACAALVVTAVPAEAVSVNRTGRACCSHVPKWYAGVSAGMVFLEDVDLNETIAFPGTFNTLSFDPGFGINGQVGYRVYDSFRLELEGMFRRNELDEVDGTPYVPGTAGTYSAQDSYGLFANAYYDWLNMSNYTPYIGGGVGVLMVKNPIIRTVNGETQSFKELTLGYQFMAGTSYAVPQTPIEVVVQYRYLTGRESEVEFIATPGYKVQFNNDSHNLELGARLAF